MPIVEADQILYFFQAGRLHEYNLLLVWSVFFVAVNVRFGKNLNWKVAANLSSQFVPSSICEQEGYDSRKAMKAAMYSHAKVNYLFWLMTGTINSTNSVCTVIVENGIRQCFCSLPSC